jgi:PKHD-type hydroxylase
MTVQGEYVRKLSFSLQLSDPEDYTGGEVQFMDNSRKTYFAPKQRGTLIMFDSRTPHRVRKVKSGMRKSLVGWVVGKRWR